MSAPVSVLITAWNAERYLGEALASALGQTAPPVEVIVVDDGSTDDTRAVAEAAGASVRVLSTEHAGIGAGRNRAIAEASQPWIAFLDADDRWRPTKLERQIERAEAEVLDAVFCRTDEFRDGPAPAGQRPPVRGAVGPLPSGTIVRTATARRIGDFDVNLRVGDWIDWWARLVDAGVRHAEVPEVLVERRLHADNNGLRNFADDKAQYLQLIRRRIERSRGDG